MLDERGAYMCQREWLCLDDDVFGSEPSCRLHRSFITVVDDCAAFLQQQAGYDAEVSMVDTVTQGDFKFTS